MQISEHFASEEFACKCGCGSCNVDSELIAKLEQLFKAMNAKYIFVSSGVRCPEHSVAVGGSRTDAHTKGIAADICVMKKNGEYYTAETIAREAEKIGFNGIGIIDNTYCHVDIRNSENFVNSHWFGNEMTGENYISTFANVGEPIYNDSAHKINIAVTIDGNKTKEIDIDF